MCQFVAVSKHLLLCRYECQKFGFWGAFLAGRFCVYITQMNFPFYRFSYLFLIRPILFLFPLANVKKIGDTMKLKVYRNGKTKEFTLTLQEQP